MAVSVGSARMRETPACSNAFRVAWSEKPPPCTEAWIRFPLGVFVLIGKGRLLVITFGFIAGTCVAAAVPPFTSVCPRFPTGFSAAQLPVMLMPNCFTTLRDTSTTVTRSIT